MKKRKLQRIHSRIFSTMSDRTTTIVYRTSRAFASFYLTGMGRASHAAVIAWAPQLSTKV